MSIYLSIYLSISTYIYINTACVVKVQLMLYGVKLGKNLWSLKIFKLVVPYISWMKEENQQFHSK